MICSAGLRAQSAPTPPTVTNPANTTVDLGGSATFSVTIGGSPAPAVQWQALESGNWLNFEVTNPSSIQPTLTFPVPSPLFNGLELRACVTNAYQVAPICSNPALLTLNTPASVSTPAGETVDVGGTAIFSVVASGTPAPAVQWNIFSGGTWKPFQTCNPTAQTASLVFPVAGCGAGITSAYNGLQFQACVTNAYSPTPVCSGTATLTVNSSGATPPTVGNPANVSASVGGTANFSVLLGGNPIPAVQWYASLAGGPFAPFEVSAPSSQTPNLSFTVPSAAYNKLQLEACVSDTVPVLPAVVPVGNCSSAPATLTLNSAPTVTNPTPQTVNVGGTAIFSVTTGGSPTPTIQWQYLNTTSVWVAFESSNPTSSQPSLAFDAATTAFNGLQFRACVTNSTSTVCSAGATLTVNSTPTIVANPVNTSVALGSDAYFNVTVGGVPTPSVQWQVFEGGSWLAFETTNASAATPNLVFPVVTSAFNGIQLRACATNSYQFAAVCSTPATLSVLTAVVLTPSYLTFPTQLEGTTSGPQTVTVKNALTTTSLNFSGVTITGANPGDFTPTTTCATVAPSGSCTVSVTFTPSGPGTRTAILNVHDSDPSSPQTIALTGVGNPPVTVLPLAITNFTAPVGTLSPYQTVSITNNNTSAAVNIGSFLFTGDFEETSTTCGTSLPYALPAGATCNVTVSFNPTLGGTRTGQLQVNDDALTSPQVVSLSGTGTSPLTVTSSSLTFSAQKLGTLSTPQTFTLTNHEVSQAETFTLTTAGNFTSSSNCSTGIINPNSSCIVSVVFAPAATATAGPLSGSVTIADSAAGGSPLGVSLIGSASTTNPPAAVAVVSPGAGSAGTAVPVVITGNGWTHFSASSVITFTDTDSASIPSDITVSGVSSSSANTINATLTIGGGSPTYGARNITVTTPLSGGGNETAFLNSAFIIADPSNAHSITSVSPAFGSQGQTMNVAITATGTSFIQGVTYANFGDGITINHLTILDATDAQANITISNTTPVGYRTVTMVTGGEFATSVLSPLGNPIFQIGPNSAKLISLNPNIEGQGTSAQIYLTASGTHFLQDATQVTIGGGVIVGDVAVTSLTSATVQIAVPPGATPGVQDATVSTGGEIATLGDAFTVVSTTPYLTSVSPSSAVQGQTLNVEIKGVHTNFSSTSPAYMLADLTGLIAVNSITVNSPTDVVLNITVNPVANVGSITARLTSIDSSGNATIFPFSFGITASSASIVSVTPNSVAQGAQVTLTVTGLNTLWNQATTTAGFYPEPGGTPIVNEVTINSPTSASLNITVPTGTPPGTSGFYMATGGQVVSSSINVYANTPSLTMSPANGMPNTTMSVTFNGQFTSWVEGTTFPVISGEGVTLSNFTVVSPVSATATLTINSIAATTSRLVTITTGGQIVTTNFNVTSTPVGLISISPYHAAQNVTLDVAIVGLNTHFSPATTTVSFGPQFTVNSVTVTDATHLSANITTSYQYAGTTYASPIGWEQVYVNTGAEMLIGGFSIDAPASPTLVSVVPSSAAQGSTEDVTITGSLTSWVNGTTEAILGAGVTVANLTITSPTTATATISVSPTAPVGGNSVVMITGTEIESGTGFSVTPSAAEIIQVGPSIPAQNCTGAFIAVAPGCGGASAVWVVKQLQTSTLSVTGVGTHWLEGETTMSFGSGVVVDKLTILSPTTATVQITVLSSSPVGYASLTASTDGEVVTLQQAIDIEEGYATLLAMTPTAGEQGATLTVQVLGRFTSFQQGVTNVAFNQDITVNSVNVIDSDNLTANITVSPWAYVDGGPCGHVLTVTTGNEQVSTSPILDNFCVQTGAAQINSVSSTSGLQGSTQSVTITGSATNFLAGVTTVSFGDPNFAVGEITVNSPTSLTASVAISTTATPGYKTVTVTTYGEVASQQYSFTVIPDEATLTEANPYQEEQGVQNVNVVLTGQYSHFSGLSTATFGAGIVVNSVSYISATQISANISIDPLAYVGSRTVTVTTPNVSCAILVNDVGNQCPGGVTTGTGNEIVSYNAFSIIPGPAIITEVSPNTGNEGQEVVFNITGSATHWQQNFTQFYIAGGGSDLTINSVVINSPTSATVDMNISPTANPGTRSVFMSTNGESLSDSGAFVVTGGVPVVTYISPNNAVQGTNQLDVTINGLYTKWDSTTAVNFGAGVTVTSFEVEDNTHIQAVLNVDPAAQVGYRTVVVATGAQGLTGNFLVTAPAPPPTPYIAYYWPSSGLPGQTFTISFTGSNTHWDPNPTTGTQATFGSGIQVNTFQVTSPTTAIANITITATAAQSNLIVFTTGSENESVGFNVVVSVPTLTIVDPGSGLQGATDLTVNILGQYTTFDSTTTFNFGAGVTVNGPPVILGPTIATQSISIDQLATLGGRSVVATTPDATASAQVVGGAGFSVTPSLALISAVTPNTAKQGATQVVEVTGQNTHWSGATVFNFGAGITVTSTTVNSATDATLTLSIPALAPIGTTDASAQTLGEIAYITHGFVVQVGTPLLLSSGPGSLRQQSSATFTILSQATTWSAASPPTVSMGAGVVITKVNVTGPTSMTVSGYVQATTAVGYRDLTVSSGTQVLTLPYALYVTYGPAVINSISPSTGGQNVNLPLVEIMGTNTNWQQGVTTLSFPEVQVNSFVVNTATSITANITPNIGAIPGQVSVTATTLGEVATVVNGFTITQTQPELLAAVPNSGPQGTTENVTLTGLYTHFGVTSVVSFGTGITVNTVTANSNTSITANITIQPTTTTGLRNVSVVTGSETVQLNNGFNITTGPAAIASLSPATGGQGTSMTVLVTGSQTNFANGVTAAVFYGGISVTSVSVVDALHANVSISIPSSTALGSYNVVMATGGETATILNGFTVTSGSAQLSGVSPPTSTQGLNGVNVNLTGLFSHFVNGTSVASFGAGITVNSTTVSNSTSAVANINISPTAALGSRTVSVTTGPETASITGGFTVLAGVPTLLSAAPGTGQAGSTLSTTITGQFTNFTGASTVSLGDGIVTNFVTYVSSTQLIANISIPSNASVGSTYVSVTTGSQTLTLNSYFSVTPGTPVITVISPNIGNPSQTLSVTITGQYTNWVNGTTTASFGPGISVGGAAAGASGPVTVNNPTSLTASIAISSGASLGPVDVITTTGGEVENVPAGFTVQAAVIPAPSLISLSPGANAGGMPINSIVTGVFSQPMNRSTITGSTVSLTLTSNPGGSVPVPGTVTLDATGRVLTFTPSSLLAVNSTYNLILTNAIKDATGNTFNYYSVDLYTTFSANVTAPTVVLANPPASSTVGTNAAVQLEFSTDMNQETQAGLVVSAGSTPVAGTYSWNSMPNCCTWGPGTILTFTPTAPLAAGTVYTVSYGSSLTDTAGNALTPGSFAFTTGSGVDSTQNYASTDIAYNQTNIGTNITPLVTYTKQVNPLDINTGTLLLYNSDSGKYVGGTVSVAANGLSATFTPNVPLLPNTYYYIHQSSGNYDVDGNYLNGFNSYFTTGSGGDSNPPQVGSISPANLATSVPLNAEVIVHFTSPINPDNVNVVTLTPSGGSPISGTATLESDLVTLIFVPNASLQQSTVYTVQVSGYTDVEGNNGSAFSSSFTTAASSLAINVSTGLNASGQLITTGGTADAHWTVVPTSSTPSESTFSAVGTPQALLVVEPGETAFYSGYVANGPTSDWILINPNSTAGNTHGVYSTTFNITTPTVPANLCLVGQMGVADNGLLGLNGVAIMSNISSYTSLTSINIPISSHLVVGTNTLALGWGSNDNDDEAFRLAAVIETCGASLTGGLTLNSSTPSNNSTGISTATTITMTFNNPLDPATVNATTLPVMIGYNSNQEIEGNYVVTGNQVVFTPDTPFPASTQIDVGTCNGPLDLAGDSAGGCYTRLMYFTTGTTTTPASTAFQVAAFSLAANATNVGLRAPVAATFNRSVDLNTINQYDFGLFTGDSQSPWCTSYSHSQDDTTVSFNCYALPSSTVMTAVLGNSIQDWQGNGLTPFTSTFTTSQYDSNTNGTVISTRPGNGASGIPANEPITLYSNLPINASTAAAGIQVAQNNAAITGTVQVLDNGYTLEFTPASPFTAGALIQWWTTASLSNSTYNTPINGASGYFYVAASTSTATPTVQTASPTMYNTVTQNTIFDTQFNTPLNASTITPTNIYLYDATTGLHPAVTYSEPQPNVVRMTPTSDLPADHYIDVYVTAGLQSTTSVPAAVAEWYEYTGLPDDTSLPVIVSAVPYNGASNVGVNVTPGVVLSKAVDPVSVNSTTFQVTAGSTPLVGTYWFNSTNTRVEFMPNAPLPPSTTLTMTINGILDQVGHPITFTSNFVTGTGPDFTSPSVLWTSIPSNGVVPTNTMVKVQFSESMDVTSFSTTSLRLYDNLLGSTVATTLSWSADQSAAYLVPTTPLAAGRSYTLYVNNSGTDLAGNQVNGYSANFSATFSSATAPPTVLLFNPISGVTGVGTNTIIEAELSAPIDPNTLGGVTLTTGSTTVPATPLLSAGNTVLQLVPQVPLAANTAYTMTIAGVKDPAGNAVATTTNTFTTGAVYDITAATVVTYDPPYNSTTGTNVTPNIVFNKPLNPITVSSSTFVMYLTDTGQQIPLNVALSADGRTVTLTPQIALLANTEYRFYGGGILQDEDGNGVSTSSYYFYTGSGAVTSGPTVIVSPLNGATGIPLNAQVLVSVSAPVESTSWNQNSVQVLNSSSSPVAGTVSLSTNSQMLSFVPTSNLTAGMVYTVNVSGFTDTNGNAVVPYSGTFTAGSSTSTTGLSFVSANIANGTTVTNNLQPIVLTFSQILDPVTVNSATLKVMNSWNGSLGLAGTYTVVGNQVTFVPASPYPAGATIYVGECGGPTDVLGEVFQSGNCYAQQLVYFTVSTASPDTTAFQVVSVSPVNGAANVGRDQSVAVTFNKSASPGSAAGYNTQLYAGQDLRDDGSVTWSADDRTMYFNVGSLYDGTTYTIDLPAGGLSDMSGNSLASDYVSTFTTEADPATGNGGVSSTAPANGATGVPTNSLLTLYLNRQANPSTVPGSLIVTVNGVVYAGSVATDASGYQIQYTPTSAFPSGATVQWFFSGASDIYGDPLNGISGDYFYTAAAVNPSTAQPVVVAISPTCCGANGVPTNTQVDIQFSQPLNAATVTTANFFRETGPAIAYTVSLISPTVVRITPTSPFAASTQYGFCSNASVLGTNGVAAQGDCYATYFTTGTALDSTPGTVTVGPPNGVVNVGTNGYIRLQFSKPADRSTVNSTNVLITNGGNPIPGSWTYNYSGTSLIGANFSPLNPLPQSSTIAVAASNILDYAGNTFASVSSSFTTAAAPDYTAPNATEDFSGGTTVGTNAVFTCRYSEPMDPSSITSSGNFIYSYAAGVTVPSTVTVSSDMMSATTTPTAPLDASSQYYYSCYNAIDLTGNGQSNSSAYFYTGTGPVTTGPTLLEANPPNGFTNVPVNTNTGPWYGSSLGLLFSEPVASNSLGGITLTPNGGSPIPIGVYPENGNTFAWVQLPYALSPNTTYTYSVSGVSDINGNAMTPTTSTFTTGSSFDFTQPTVSAVSPANGATSVVHSATVTVTFNEAMSPVLIDSNHIYLRTHNTQTLVPTTLTISADSKTVTLTPTAPLSAATIYDVVTTSPNWDLTDIAGNVYNTTGVQSTFTTQ